MHFYKKLIQLGGSISIVCLAFCRTVFAEPFFDPADSKLTAEYTNVNYYLNSLVGEDEYFADDFYDDYLVSLEGKPIVHFTKRNGEAVDFYFYVEDPGNLKIIKDFFESHVTQVNAISPKILPAFLSYYKFIPAYSRDGLYGKVSKVITTSANIDVEPVLTEHSRRKLDNAVYQYLRSNGIRNLKDIPKNNELLKIMVDKFFMLSTTCFYRAWDAIEKSRPYIKEASRQAKEQGRPLKLKVFAASTGEEVMTYAVELFEMGITDFTILASDINESSMKFASAMRYSKTSFEQLSLASQDKLKKYFRLNDLLGFWEPRDPQMFKSRIKYINQDILKPLPDDLEPRFKGPYDLISILNVLMYLDDPAVQKQKDYWVSILNDHGGILILHDKLYSILRRKLGDKWSIDNFLLLDDWVNSRDTRLTIQDKVAIYEKEYDINQDTSLIRLNNAYMSAGMPDKARILCEDYVNKKPFSFIGLYLLLEHYVTEKNVDSAAAIAARLARVYVFPERILDSLSGLQHSKEAYLFLQDLKKENQRFIDNYKSNPAAYESVFDNMANRGGKWDAIRLVLKASAYGYLQRYYLKNNDIPKAEQMSDACLELLNSISKGQNKDYYIAARFLDEILRDLAYYYIAKKEYSKLYDFCSRCIKLFSGVYDGVDYVFIDDGAGFSYLNKAIIMDIRHEYDQEFFNILTSAVKHYRKVLPQEENMGQSNMRGINQEIGHCYMLEGKAYMANGDKRKAVESWSKSLGYFEAAIAMDPVYSREVLKLRTELFNLAKKDGVDITSVEVQ